MYPTRALPRTLAEGAVDATDRRAVEQVLGGDRGAFRVLVDRHQRGVHAVIYRLVGNPADAEELTQQTFLAAFDALARFDVERRFSSWLYRIAVNQAKDHLKSPRRGELPVAEAEPLAVATSTPPDDAAATAEELRLVERALASLSFRDREVLVLKDIEELPYEEIRAIVGRPITALKIRVVRARQRLRAALAALHGSARA